jgi:hypothetical protein
MWYVIAYCDDLCYSELPLGPAFQVDPFAFAQSGIDYMDMKWKLSELGLGFARSHSIGSRRRFGITPPL